MLAAVSPLLLTCWLLEELPAHQVPTPTTTLTPQCPPRGRASSASSTMWVWDPPAAFANAC